MRRSFSSYCLCSSQRLCSQARHTREAGGGAENASWPAIAGREEGEGRVAVPCFLHEDESDLDAVLPGMSRFLSGCNIGAVGAETVVAALKDQRPTSEDPDTITALDLSGAARRLRLPLT